MEGVYGDGTRRHTVGLYGGVYAGGIWRGIWGWNEETYCGLALLTLILTLTLTRSANFDIESA